MRSLRIIASTFAVSLICVSQINAQEPGSPNAPLRVIEYDGNMAALLAQLAEMYATTIGIQADAQKPDSQIKISLRDATFADMLNAIVQSEPRYQWREVNRRIEFVPVNNGQSLLDTPINALQFKDLGCESAMTRVIDSPEVQAMMLSQRWSHRSEQTCAADRKVSLNLSAASMRQALSEITENSGGRFWIFRTFPDGTFSVKQKPH